MYAHRKPFSFQRECSLVSPASRFHRPVPSDLDGVVWNVSLGLGALDVGHDEAVARLRTWVSSQSSRRWLDEALLTATIGVTELERGFVAVVNARVALSCLHVGASSASAGSAAETISDRPNGGEPAASEAAALEEGREHGQAGAHDSNCTLDGAGSKKLVIRFVICVVALQKKK
jgi:hypothetical protein